MTDKQQLTVLGPNNMAVANHGPFELVSKALDKDGLDPAILREMLEVMKDAEAHAARRAFVAAMAAFKADCPSVLSRTRKARFSAKGGVTEYKWTPLEDIIEQVTPHLSEHGLSARFSHDQEKGVVTVTCIIEHEGGHAERTSLTAPHDTSGSKNSVQAVGSTVSYLQRYTLLGALGLATADLDDVDCNTGEVKRPSGGPGRPPKERVKHLANLLDQVGPALQKKHQMILDLARRGKHLDIEPAIEELEKSQEPG